jgi:hypothetical protein
MQKRLKVADKESIVNEAEEALLSSLEREASKGRFLLERKSQFSLSSGSKITSADLREDSQAGILVVGQSNGVFSVYNLDNLQPIQSFQIAQNRIDSVCLNQGAEWIAMGSREQG